MCRVWHAHYSVEVGAVIIQKSAHHEQFGDLFNVFSNSPRYWDW
jgi:hypothetical protein